MPAKKLSLFCAVCAIALVSGSWFVGSSTLIANDGRSNAAKPPQNQVEMVAAQAWRTAVENAAAAQQARPLVRIENRRYRRRLFQVKAAGFSFASTTPAAPPRYTHSNRTRSNGHGACPTPPTAKLEDLARTLTPAHDIDQRLRRHAPRPPAGRSSPRCRPRSSPIPRTRSIRTRRKSRCLINTCGSPVCPARLRSRSRLCRYSAQPTSPGCTWF